MLFHKTSFFPIFLKWSSTSVDNSKNIAYNDESYIVLKQEFVGNKTFYWANLCSGAGVVGLWDDKFTICILAWLFDVHAFMASDKIGLLPWEYFLAHCGLLFLWYFKNDKWNWKHGSKITEHHCVLTFRRCFIV